MMNEKSFNDNEDTTKTEELDDKSYDDCDLCQACGEFLDECSCTIEDEEDEDLDEE